MTVFIKLYKKNQIEFLSRTLVRFMTFPLELNGDPGKHNRMLVRTSPKKIPTADMLTAPWPSTAPKGLRLTQAQSDRDVCAWYTQHFTITD